jgi:hypothetical protein
MGSHGLNVAKKLPLSSTGMTPPEEVICNANNTMAVALPASPMKQVRALITGAHDGARQGPWIDHIHLQHHKHSEKNEQALQQNKAARQQQLAQPLGHWMVGLGLLGK